tara:strand:- start:2699 stop:3655 length:957 start_codon:yes stop_codon:yes gene_type:complete
MGVLGNYYYDGTSFAAANVLCTDAALLTTAADGWYSQGGVYRSLLSGILNTVVTCPSCVYGCGSPTVSSSIYGRHIITVDIGNTIGAVLIRFTVASPLNASRATWNWNGITASEYSSPNFGYCEGLIGDEDIAGITMGGGSGGATFTGTDYTYQGGVFNAGAVSTWGPYTDVFSGGVTLESGGGYGTLIMVVPKTLAAPDTLEIIVDTTSVVGTNNFSLEVDCPAQLPAFSGLQNNFAPLGDACGNTDPDDYIFHHAVVSSLSSPGNPAVNDWVFQDANGDIPVSGSSVAPGQYRVFVGGMNQKMYVSDGVITSLTPC